MFQHDIKHTGRYIPSSRANNFIRGDANRNGGVEISDAVRILNYLFQGGREPLCLDAADTDDDGVIKLTDAVKILLHLFQGGAPPSPPYPVIGIDPTPDNLEC